VGSPGRGEPDYARLLRFRTALRAFLRWSEQSAQQAGLTPAQHQLLLAVKGHGDRAPTIGDLANDLMLRHHSTGELVGRATDAGLVVRAADQSDRRQIRVRLTRAGDEVLRRLSEQHLDEIRRLAPIVEALAQD
jgi:DNA-binding MarR family transcriptional regulator